MNTLNTTNLLILGLFLGVTLLIGWFSGSNVKTLKEYVLANKSMGSGLLMVTILATLIGASDLGSSGMAYRSGINEYISYFSLSAGLVILGLLIVPNLAYFPNALTSGDIAYTLYGRWGKRLVGIVGLFSSLAVIGHQCYAAGHLAEKFQIPPSLLIISLTLTVTCYALRSGVRGIAVTDILQFLAIFVTILVIYTRLMQGQSMAGFFNKLVHHTDALSIKKGEGLIGTLRRNGIFNLLPTFLLFPPIMQRALMAKNKAQIKRVFLGASAFMLLVGSLFILIGLVALVKHPELAPKVCRPKGYASAALPWLLSHYFKGLGCTVLGLGLLAVLMSTIDSFLHAAGMTVVRDIMEIQAKNKKEEVKTILYSRISVVLLGLVVSIFFAIIPYKAGGGIFFRLIFFPLCYLTFPMVAGILGIKTESKSLFVSFGTGLLSLLVLHQGIGLSLTDSRYTALFFSTLASIIAFILTHLIQNKGIAWVDREKMLRDTNTPFETVWMPSWEWCKYTLKSLIPSLDNLIDRANSAADKVGPHPVGFTMGFLSLTMTPYFLQMYHHTEHLSWIMALRAIAGVLCLSLFFKERWAYTTKRKYFNLLWFITLTYCIPFLTTLGFLMDGGGTQWVITIFMAILCLITLVSWKAFIVLNLSGIAVALLASIVIPTAPEWNMTLADTLYLIFGVGIGTITAVVFGYFKDNDLQRLLKYNRGLSGTLGHEINLYNQAIATQTQVLDLELTRKVTHNKDHTYTLTQSTHENLKKTHKDTLFFGKETQHMIQFFGQLMRFGIESIAKEKIKLDKLVSKAMHNFKRIAPLETQHLTFTLNTGTTSLEVPGEMGDSNGFKVYGHESFIEHLLFNLIKNSLAHGGKAMRHIDVTINPQKRTLTYTDDGRGIPFSYLSMIWEVGYSTGGQGLGLPFVKSLVEAMGATVTCDSEQGKKSYTRFCITFPELTPAFIKWEETSLSRLRDRLLWSQGRLKKKEEAEVRKGSSRETTPRDYE